MTADHTLSPRLMHMADTHIFGTQEPVMEILGTPGSDGRGLEDSNQARLLLTAETKYLTLKIKGRKIYLAFGLYRF